ncbi:MAG: caspase family protein [Hyphomicrobiaceae bacterium]
MPHLLNRIFSMFVILILTVATSLPLSLVFESGRVHAQDHGTRKALVIGNSRYEKIEPLKNPVNDANDINAKLIEIGFKTTLVIDAKRDDVVRAIDEFVDGATSDDVAFVFYAGHGYQHRGRNILAPVDVYWNEFTGELENAFDVTEALAKLNNAFSARILFLDACRQDPSLLRSQSRPTRLASGKSTTATRSMLARTINRRTNLGYANGFGRINSNEPGTFIGYATATGQVAMDQLDGSRNSAFTRALLKHIQRPGLQVSEMFRLVRADVYKSTSLLRGSKSSTGFQLPWNESSLVRPFHFVPPLRPGVKQERPHRLQQPDYNGGATIDLAQSRDSAAVVQAELKRLQCYAGKVDGLWGRRSRQALGLYFRTIRRDLAGVTRSDMDRISLNLMKQLRQTNEAVCPVTAIATIPNATRPANRSWAPRRTLPRQRRTTRRRERTRNSAASSKPRRAQRNSGASSNISVGVGAGGISF